MTDRSSAQQTEPHDLTATLRVVGIPAPQGSKSRMPNGAIVEGSSKTGRAAVAAWRGAVADAARSWIVERGCPPMDGPLAVTIEFRFPLPKGDQHRIRHATKPDIDKLERATLDALKQGGLIADDARVYRVDKAKIYARDEPVGADITVESHAHLEAADREQSKADARSRRAS